MGKPTLKKRFLTWLGGIGWRLFIWAEWGTDEAYHDAIDREVRALLPTKEKE